MIKENTVFVLGAGASMPYGFPSGLKLLKEIVKNTSSGGAYLSKLNEFGFGNDFINSFSQELEFSQQPSIDLYLESNVNHILLGKYCIALAIIAYERKRIFSVNYIESTWYKYLSDNIGNKLEDIINNNISIITFNYDRSIEYYFYYLLKNSFNLSDLDIQNIFIKNFNISHFYGNVANPHFLDKEFGRKFEPKFSNEELENSTSAINIMTEENINTENIDASRKLIQENENIVFLGFGFHKSNVDRLLRGIPLYNKNIMGTVFSMTIREYEPIKSYMILEYGAKRAINFQDYTSLEFLRNSPLFKYN